MGKENMFQFRNNILHCEDVSLENDDYTEPYFVYSKVQLSENVEYYLEALGSIPADTWLNFSMKANYNPHLIETMKDSGLTGATCVSINEVRLALKLGFVPKRIILNGNGKTRKELEEAVSHG